MSRVPMRGRRGAESIEFAIILPVFLLILGGMLDIGWLFFTRSALNASANTGCRAGALIDPGDGDVELDTVRQVASDAMVAALASNGGGDCDAGSCTTEVETFGDRPGRSLLCTMSKDFTPLLGMVLDPMTLESHMAVRLEWQREP